MKLNATLAVSTVALLAACGGGSSGVSNEPTLRTIQQNLVGGTPISAPDSSTAAIRLDYENGATEVTSARPMQLRLPQDGVLELVYGENRYIFTEEHIQRNDDGSIEGLVWNPDGGDYVQIYGISSSIDELSNPNSSDYLALVDYMVIERDDIGNGHFGYVLLGDQTPVSALGGFAVENFSGGFGAELLPSQYSDATRTGRANREMLHGGASATIDFQQNTVTLTLANPRYRQYNQHELLVDTRLNGEILLGQGSLQGADFAGSFDIAAEPLADINLQSLRGSFSGSLYGPNANSVGAIFSGTGSRAGDNLTFAGGLEASR